MKYQRLRSFLSVSSPNMAAAHSSINNIYEPEKFCYQSFMMLFFQINSEFVLWCWFLRFAAFLLSKTQI